MRHAGFVVGAELVDNTAFAVSPAEAAAMDPCQRLLLELGYAALHGAATDRAALGGSLAGVFLGFAGGEFGQALASSSPMGGGSVYAATGSASSIASGRLPYTLGLHGPCASYDTACSAALAASHAAVCGLHRSEAAVGLAVLEFARRVLGAAKNQALITYASVTKDVVVRGIFAGEISAGSDRVGRLISDYLLSPDGVHEIMTEVAANRWTRPRFVDAPAHERRQLVEVQLLVRLRPEAARRLAARQRGVRRRVRPWGWARPVARARRVV